MLALLTACTALIIARPRTVLATEGDTVITCEIKALAFELGPEIFPGCLRGKNSRECHEEKTAVYDSLGLGQGCTGVPSRPVPPNEFSASISPTSTLPTWYVSATGNDANDGTSIQKAVRSLVRARNLTRKSNAVERRIMLLAGTHRLSAPLTLTSEDSGLTIEGFDDTTTLSAAIHLQGLEWTKFSSNSNIYVADVLNADRFDDLSRLFINNEPAVRARAPNINTYHDHAFFPVKGNAASWSYKANNGNRAINIVKRKVSPNNKRYSDFVMARNGRCTGIFTPAAGYWCHDKADGDLKCPLKWPSGLTVTTALSNELKLTKWANKLSSNAYVHVLHPLLWGGWTFKVGKFSGKTMSFSKGGFQEARGNCGKGAHSFYLENMLELLDHANEFFYDTVQSKLYYYSNEAPGQEVELGTKAMRLIQVLGTSANPVQNIKIQNLKFEKTYPTHMEPHEMPSGGDIAIHRGGALFFEGVENITVTDCHFSSMGSNGIFVSNYAKRVAIESNTFVGLEGGPVLLVGDPIFDSTEPWDRTRDEEYVSHVTVRNNFMRDFGLVEMQSAGVMMSIASNVVVERNTVFNSPRAAVVLNDQWKGNIHVEQNLFFNNVRETMDHGPYNVWDRQQWIFPRGEKLAPVVVARNFMIATFDGQKIVDMDDTAKNHLVKDNILVHGYVKFKGWNLTATDNVIVALHPQQEIGCLLILQAHRLPAQFTYTNNVCFTEKLNAYYWRNPVQTLCVPKHLNAQNNTNYGYKVFTEKKKKFGWKCGSNVSKWQSKYRQDLHSTWDSNPAEKDRIVSTCREKAKKIWK